MAPHQATPPAFDKKACYEKAMIDLEALLEGETDTIALMASISCVLKSHLPTYYWAGFYIHKNDALIVGPYQGTVGCLHIAMGRGVCGTAAASLQTVIVENVHDFPGHIACDAATNSEIVVPIRNAENRLIAVFDVDSTFPAAFDTLDQTHLERMAEVFFRSRALT